MRSGCRLDRFFWLCYTNSTETLRCSEIFGLTQETGPNGDTTALLYDAYARLAQTTYPTGATTAFGYLTSTGATTATTNNQWTKKTLDGFGRVIRVEAGYGSTTVSQTDTEYDSCGCSPVGKRKRVSMPHAPNATVYWTTYNYDGLGRTVGVWCRGSCCGRIWIPRMGTTMKRS